MKRKTWIFLGVGAIVVAAGAAFLLTRPKDEVKWRMSKVDKGSITQKINATGAVSPVVQVAVGTQVSGVISALYADYNSIVKKGQVIAQIDPTVWLTNLKDAEASLDRAKANMDDAKRQLDRAKRLWGEKLLADQDLEAKQVTYQTSLTSFENAKAALDRAKANLGYCDITAPVDGVVISRLADVGQTVAASFSTPNLFQIAQDLSRMQVQVSIGESDIDEIKVGQRAFFVVDSLPDKQFVATVSRVRQEPVTQQNVVNYVVEMVVPNEPLPGAESEGPVKEGGAPAKAEGKGLGQHGRWAGGDAPKGAGREAVKTGGRDEAPDPDKLWERMKDRMPAGTTKEEFMKRFKERMASRGQGSAAKAPPALPTAPVGADVQALAHTPGGASLLPGPKFTGNLCLRPGMTANVTIITNQKRDVVRVPNSALRFNPSAFIKDEAKKDAPKAGGLGQPMGMGMFGRPGGGGGQGGGGSKGGLMARREDRIWTLENGKPKAIVVKTGITDGQFTEITAEGLNEGIPVLIGVENTRTAAQAPLSGPGGGQKR